MASDPENSADLDMDAEADRQQLMSMQALSGTLAGLCITGVTIFVSSSKYNHAQKIADGVLVVSGLFFMLHVYASYLILRRRRMSRLRWLRTAVDVLFHTAMLGMVAAGFLMVYTDL